MIKGKKYLKKQAVASVLALSMAAASLTGCTEQFEEGIVQCRYDDTGRGIYNKGHGDWRL